MSAETSTHKKYFLILLLVSLLARLIYFFRYDVLWWDPAIYLGMGKYLFSGGNLGLWELYRPVIWPIFIGGIWKLGFDALLIAKIIVLLLSIGCIILIYLLGKRFHPTVGLFAATIFSFTPVFFQFSVIQITDIPALFFSLLAIYLAITNRYFFSGLSVGIAFGLRFPHALTIIIIGLYVLLIGYQERRIIEPLKRLIFLGSGFLIVLGPYLLSNYSLYGNILYPLIEAQKVVTWTVIAGRGLTYYFATLFITQPLLLLALPGIILGYREFRSERKLYTLLSIALVLLTVYYTIEAHKELRYALAFLPYWALFAGIATYSFGKTLLKRIRSSRTIEQLAFLLIMIFTTLTVIVLATSTLYYSEGLDEQTEQFYSYFANTSGIVIFGASPEVVAYSDVKLERYAYWPNVPKQYAAAGPVDYVTLNSCKVYCKDDPNCERVKQEFLEKLSQEATLVFNATSTKGCELQIYALQF